MCDGLPLRLVGALFSCVLGVAGTGGASAPELGPLISGSVSYVGGVHVATDYVYDDGADPENAADFVQLQVSRDASGDWHVRAILETLLDPNVPLVGVGFDLDGSSATGAAAPPGGAWTPQGSLGLEALVAISSDGTIVLHWNGTQWSSAAQLSSSIDPIANTLDASIPGALLAAAGPTVQLVGLVGPVWGGSSWLAGGSIHDLAYVKGEAPSGLQNAKQSAVLAGTAPASEATARRPSSRWPRRPAGTRGSTTRGSTWARGSGTPSSRARTAHRCRSAISTPARISPISCACPTHCHSPRRS